jgi:hypothetical protein
MKSTAYIVAWLFTLTACSSPVVTSQRTETIDGNHLQITSGTNDAGHFIKVENADKRWAGSYAGGKEQWGARKKLLDREYREEIHAICGEWFYQMDRERPPSYNMLDSDETMGGLAPVLGVAASMAAYAAAYSSTSDANVPVSIYGEFRCRRDNEENL